MCISNL